MFYAILPGAGYLFSYRHSFHAGNHADVLKHICQMLIIEKLKSKDKGFVYIDTHSGAGVYDLDAVEAQKTLEYQQGIARLAHYTGDNEAILAYQTLTAKYLKHDQYPGSPEIAHALLRPQDNLQLMEWHNQEVVNLRHNLRGKHIAIHHRDGNEGLVAITPPKPARGMVLIDPSYETPEDYHQVVATLSKAYKKWPTGIYAIWYPLLLKRSNGDRNAGDRNAQQQESFAGATSKQGKSQQMLEQLKLQGFKNMLSVELNVQDESRDEGMYGSGMVIINPPWQLDEQLRACLQDLVPLLGQSPQAKSTVNWLIADE